MEEKKIDYSEEVAVKYWGKKDEKTYAEICQRVIDYIYGSEDTEEAQEMYNALLNKTLMPNSPVFMNSNTGIPSLAACFVLPVEDSMEGIFGTVKDLAMVLKSGGGVGMSLSKLRPSGADVKSTKGVSSGPISFLKVFDAVVNSVKSGGVRRGAALANLRVDHPDILEFIRCKSRENDISNFNISVAITDEFMQAYEAGSPFYLRHEKMDAPVKVDPAMILDQIVDSSWSNGEPGIQFLGNMAKTDVYCSQEKYMKYNQDIEVSNPLTLAAH